MNKRLLVIFLVLGVTLCGCPAAFELQDLQASSIQFSMMGPADMGALKEEAFIQNLRNSFLQVPMVALGIQDIVTNSAYITSFYFKVIEASRNFLKINFKKQQSGIWTNIRIVYMAAIRNDMVLGSIYTQFGSLVGSKAISRAIFSQKLSSTTGIARAFINGYSVNSMKSIQVSLAKQTISDRNQLLVQVITGPDFNLKQIWYSFIIFSPATVIFTSFGKTYQEIQFRGSISHDITDLIQHTNYRFLGLSLLSILTLQNKSMKIQSGITEDFVLFLKSEEFLDKISLNYVVFGKTPEEVCSRCLEKNAFKEECVDQCPKGTYRYKFDRRVGYGCRICPSELNLVVNSRGTGCECNSYSIYKSGICEKVFIENDPEVLQTPQQASPVKQTPKPTTLNTTTPTQIQLIYQIGNQPAINNDCSSLKNTYWTGYRCACKIGYIALQNGCQSFQSYIKLLSYSSSLYPSQQETRSSGLIAENPCNLYELRVNGVCQCKFNYYKSGTGECIECPPNSIYNSQNRKCECQKNFKLNERINVCVINCKVNEELDTYTKECVCKKGYGLVDGLCKECRQEDGGYLAFGKCFFCPGNTRFLGAECGCPEGQILEPGNLCRQCRLFETPYNNTCQCFYPYIRNQINGFCEKTCTIRQIKIFGRCIDCPAYSYNSGMNVCVCDDGFVLVDRKCVPMNRSCIDGFYKKNGYGQCIVCPTPNCQKCDNSGKCTDCIANHQLGPDFYCRSICGDSKILQPLEECDDGNRIGGDGCDEHCKKEPGYFCFGQPTFCLSICGNGLVTRYQKCDDGNKNDGDGCSSKCVIENGYSCFGSPSQCVQYTPNG